MESGARRRRFPVANDNPSAALAAGHPETEQTDGQQRKGYGLRDPGWGCDKGKRYVKVSRPTAAFAVDEIE